MSDCTYDLFPSLHTLLTWVLFYLAFRGLLDIIRTHLSGMWILSSMLRFPTKKQNRFVWSLLNEFLTILARAYMKLMWQPSRQNEESHNINLEKFLSELNHLKNLKNNETPTEVQMLSDPTTEPESPISVTAE